jgi:hypothetical protein
MTAPSLPSLPSLSLARFLGVLLLAVLVGPAARPALAQTLKVEGSGEARAHEGTKEVAPTVKLGTAPHIIALASIQSGSAGLINPVHLEASVIGSGYADYGRLGGEVVSQARSVADFFHNFEPFAHGILRLGFTDTVTVVAPTLAPGTPVPVEFVSTLSSAIQVTQPNLFSGPLSNSASISYDVEVKDLSTAQTIRSAHGHGMAGPSPSPQTLSFASSVGAVFQLSGEMDLVASAFAPARFGHAETLATSAAKASNTGHLFFRPITPGVTLSSASGHDYDINAASTAAPEPSALVLVAFVATASGLTPPVTGRVRRRRRSREDGRGIHPADVGTTDVKGQR